LARPEGIEPPAYRFEACRSIQLSYGRTEDLEKGVDEFRRKNTTRRSTRAMLESLFALASVAASVPLLCFTTTLGPVAQLAEQQTLNLRVVGSIPTRLTIFSSALSDGAK
jgi:hypothetical protein